MSNYRLSKQNPHINHSQQNSATYNPTDLIPVCVTVRISAVAVRQPTGHLPKPGNNGLTDRPMNVSLLSLIFSAYTTPHGENGREKRASFQTNGKDGDALSHLSSSHAVQSSSANSYPLRRMPDPRCLSVCGMEITPMCSSDRHRRPRSAWCVGSLGGLLFLHNPGLRHNRSHSSLFVSCSLSCVTSVMIRSSVSTQ